MDDDSLPLGRVLVPPPSTPIGGKILKQDEPLESFKTAGLPPVLKDSRGSVRRRVTLATCRLNGGNLSD